MKPFDYRELDDLIHSRIRLSVMAILASVDDAEFTFLRDSIGTTDGNLSTHVARLLDAGYVVVDRTTEGGRSVSRYALTAEGRAGFRAYLDRMDQLLKGVEP